MVNKVVVHKEMKMWTWKTRRKSKVVNSKYVEIVTLRDGKYKLYKQKPVMFRYHIRHSLMHVS